MSESKPLTAIALERANTELQETLELCRDNNSGLTDKAKFQLRHDKAMAVIQAANAELRSLREEFE